MVAYPFLYYFYLVWYFRHCTGLTLRHFLSEIGVAEEEWNPASPAYVRASKYGCIVWNKVSTSFECTCPDRLFTPQVRVCPQVPVNVTDRACSAHVGVLSDSRLIRAGEVLSLRVVYTLWGCVSTPPVSTRHSPFWGVRKGWSGVVLGLLCIYMCEVL